MKCDRKFDNTRLPDSNKSKFSSGGLDTTHGICQSVAARIRSRHHVTLLLFCLLSLKLVTSLELGDGNYSIRLVAEQTC